MRFIKISINERGCDKSALLDLSKIDKSQRSRSREHNSVDKDNTLLNAGVGVQASDTLH